jgi:hypothetical protein
MTISKKQLKTRICYPENSQELAELSLLAEIDVEDEAVMCDFVNYKFGDFIRNYCSFDYIRDIDFGFECLMNREEFTKLPDLIQQASSQEISR